MNIAYFGTPQLSAQLLDKLLQHNLPIKLVVTQPDKPVGKKLEITASYVKKIATEKDIQLFDIALTKQASAELSKILKEKNIELCILFAYGELIRSDLLQTPKYGFLNIHPSLLPKFRGSSPTVYPFLLGEKITGATLMQMNEKFDEGDIIDQIAINLTERSLRTAVETELIDIASKQIISFLHNLGRIQSRPQDHSSATYTRKIQRNDGHLSVQLIARACEGVSTISQHEIPSIISEYFETNGLSSIPPMTPAEIVSRMFRALSPWPGIWTKVSIDGQEKRLKILDVKNISNVKIEILKVQLEGKNPVDFRTFERAYNIFGS